MEIGILLFDGVDLVDSGGPYEVFLTASRLQERTGQRGIFNVQTMSIDGSSVTAYGGLGLIPQIGVADCHSLDVVIIPGTIDLQSAENNQDLLAAIKHLAAISTLTTSVCTGAFLLAATGLLEGRPWTTHWEDIDDLAQRTKTPGTRGVRWVDAGSVITSGGLTAGFDMALHIVARLVSIDLAKQTARQLDHRWHPDPASDQTFAC